VKWTDYYRLPEGDMPVAVTIPAGARPRRWRSRQGPTPLGANPETAVFTISAGPSYPSARQFRHDRDHSRPAGRANPASPDPAPIASAARRPAPPPPPEARWTTPTWSTPAVGDNALRVLTPTLLELRQLNTKAPDPATGLQLEPRERERPVRRPATSEFT
jgi:hypothetical protein